MDGFMERRVFDPTAPGQTAKFEEFAYNVRGLLQTMTDRKGIVTTFAYDDLGRLIDKSFALPIGSSDATTPPVHYSYDAVGRMLTAANGSDALTWSYDQAGDVITEQSSEKATTVAYAYDAAGNRASISLNGTLHLTYGYDDGSRLTTITKGSAVFGFGYDVLSRRSSMTYPNGVATVYGYELLSGRLSTIAAAVTATGAPITAFSYAHDLVGNRTQKASLESTETYSYDRQYRLTKADRVGVGAVASTYSVWAYDDAGNRTASQSESSVTKASYNEKNQLTETTAGGPMLWRGVLSEPAVVTVSSANTTDQPARLLPGNVFEADLTLPFGSNTVSVKARDGSGNQTTNDYTINVTGDRAEFTYDLNGNLTRKIDAPGTAEQVVWTYSWNALNQLIEVKKGATLGAVASVAAFEYDPVGRRIEKTASSSTTKWAYDGMDILREALTGSGSGTFTYVHGPGIDEPLARINQSTSAAEYYHADGLGSIGKLTDSAGGAVHTYSYSAWGNIEVGAVRPGFAFTGREWDPETGLYYYRARYYDPRAGRFVSEDPAGLAGGSNLFGYVQNAPGSTTDPSGLFSAENHAFIYNVALEGTLNQYQLRVIENASVFADKDQGARSAYRHAMTPASWSKADQRQAVIDYAKFVHDELSIAAACADRYGADSNPALWHLGLALHALTDSQSAAHRGMKDWWGFNWKQAVFQLWDNGPHYSYDHHPGSSELSAAAELVNWAYQEYTNRQTVRR